MAAQIFDLKFILAKKWMVRPAKETKIGSKKNKKMMLKDILNIYQQQYFNMTEIRAECGRILTIKFLCFMGGLKNWPLLKLHCHCWPHVSCSLPDACTDLSLLL